MDRNGYFEHIEAAREMGIDAYKFHTYKGGKADIPLFEEVRNAVGPDFDLINDPVCSYDLREAIEVGRVMEELGFVWLEEPFHEQKMHRYQELCAALDMPVMANEMLMHDIGISTQWLMHGATDLLRANARHGTTLVLKMAHFAELYDTTIEMNAAGGRVRPHPRHARLLHRQHPLLRVHELRARHAAQAGRAVGDGERARRGGRPSGPHRPAWLGRRVGRRPVSVADRGGTVNRWSCCRTHSACWVVVTIEL